MNQLGHSLLSSESRVIRETVCNLAVLIHLFQNRVLRDRVHCSRLNNRLENLTMLFAIASIVLSAILMTQANVTDIVGTDVISEAVTNVEPLSEELYIYDVTSDAPVSELKGALESAGVEVRHSFQVLGTPQYFFVVVDDGSDALSQLTFPVGSLVTQYPAEHLDEFLEMVGVDGWNVSDTAGGLDDNDLVVINWEFVVPEGISTSEMKSMMTSFASVYRKPNQIVQPAEYAVVGRNPPKIYFFMNLDENSLQKAILEGLDAAGGPGNNVINVLRLRKV
ncbi:uncharacterized protein [Littorina saxatilis]|uniref:uncharacterized protein isoform X1 n=1 Tax=Littorina saxatilis TaxID=31220 RepID=UPI0038B42599